MRVLDKKLIFSVLIGIFAFYILFIFINNNQEVVDSRNLVCSENIDIENIISTILFLKTNRKCKFKQLIDITAVDYPQNEKRFKLVYL